LAHHVGSENLAISCNGTEPSRFYDDGTVHIAVLDDCTAQADAHPGVSVPRSLVLDGRTGLECGCKFVEQSDDPVTGGLSDHPAMRLHRRAKAAVVLKPDRMRHRLGARHVFIR
jgi:hypothetical protein